MAAIDPTTLRMSDNFLLSDFMGCDSVYRHGYANPISDSLNDLAKIEQGKALATELDWLVEEFGHLSVTYGFISPGLSRKIVKYQDPDKPSYHRWDLGAAADICAHYYLTSGTFSPIRMVWSMCEMGYTFDRIITYSESEIICYAISTLHAPMNKVYENRYVGVPRPKFIKYPTNKDSVRNVMLKDASLEVVNTWRGTGYPQYHGGGRKQYEHHRIGDHTLLSDFLYSPHKVHKGIPNRPPEGDRAEEVIRCAADFNDRLAHRHRPYGARSSIVFAIDCNDRPWTDRYVIDYSPSLLFKDANDKGRSLFDDAANGVPHVEEVRIVRMKRGGIRFRVIGSRV